MYVLPRFYIASCADFVTKSLEDWQEFVAKKNLCFNCLGSHYFNECRTIKRCRCCKGQHHTLFYREAVAPASVATTAQSTLFSDTASSTLGMTNVHAALSHLTASSIAKESPQVLLATARVRFIIDHAKSFNVWVLLDQGSEVSLVQESLMQFIASFTSSCLHADHRCQRSSHRFIERRVSSALIVCQAVD